ncbi:RodZ domain-containing protein [Sphaerospermopsis sp. FACHB-1194]|uniref:helix-turn-helix domain-containing protein n=1 Tax=Sphaerospermopsis sp. FACHB-1194 TaxID=2692862 RepID=UPI001680F6CC|nr:RodZ domain-containing protein [Sphaerospermopsis sp. FACHB-1194]MBD2147464.1 helix-turn-helix domain-containing protein [Sphaerospermopsis sp. FACHB-1194]
MKWLRKKDEKPSKPSIEEQQAEKLAQMGAKLAVLRQQKGLSMDEIVLITRIPRRLLNAIEVGDLSDLPEPIYTQGLIRQFADALGVKGAEFASHFPLGSQKVSFQRNWQPQPFFQLRPFHLYLLYIVVIVCSVTSLSQLLNQTALEANNSQNQLKAEKNDDLKPQKLQAQDLKAIPFDINSSETETVEIDVTLQSSSWVRIVADGKTEFEGVLPKGSHRKWKAAEELTVKTDNAGGVLMSVNQQQPKQMGQPGKFQEVRIAAKVRS